MSADQLTQVYSGKVQTTWASKYPMIPVPKAIQLIIDSANKWRDDRSLESVSKDRLSNDIVNSDATINIPKSNLSNSTFNQTSNMENINNDHIQDSNSIVKTLVSTAWAPMNSILAEDIYSPIHVPEYLTSIMDGFAISELDHTFSSDSNTKESNNITTIDKTLDVIGGSFAGETTASNVLLKPNEAMYVTTGSQVPINTTSVVPVEDCIGNAFLASNCTKIKLLPQTIHKYFGPWKLCNNINDNHYETYETSTPTSTPTPTSTSASIPTSTSASTSSHISTTYVAKKPTQTFIRPIGSDIGKDSLLLSKGIVLSAAYIGLLLSAQVFTIPILVRKGQVNDIQRECEACLEYYTNNSLVQDQGQGKTHTKDIDDNDDKNDHMNNDVGISSFDIPLLPIMDIIPSFEDPSMIDNLPIIPRGDAELKSTSNLKANALASTSIPTSTSANLSISSTSTAIKILILSTGDELINGMIIPVDYNAYLNSETTHTSNTNSATYQFKNTQVPKSGIVDSNTATLHRMICEHIDRIHEYYTSIFSRIRQEERYSQYRDIIIKYGSKSNIYPDIIIHTHRILEDDYETTEKTLLQANKDYDIVISSGGVSMGEKDFVKKILEKHFVLQFGRLHMKPGKPATMAYGRKYCETTGIDTGINADATIPSKNSSNFNLRKTEKSALMFGLPGNPVSAFVCCHLLVLPAITTMLAPLPLNSNLESIINSKYHDFFKINSIMDTQNVVYGMLTSPITTDPERPEYHRVYISAAPFIATSAPSIDEVGIDKAVTVAKESTLNIDEMISELTSLTKNMSQKELLYHIASETDKDPIRALQSRITHEKYTKIKSWMKGIECNDSVLYESDKPNDHNGFNDLHGLHELRVLHEPDNAFNLPTQVHRILVTSTGKQTSCRVLSIIHFNAFAYISTSHPNIQIHCLEKGLQPDNLPAKDLVLPVGSIIPCYPVESTLDSSVFLQKLDNFNKNTNKSTNNVVSECENINNWDIDNNNNNDNSNNNSLATLLHFEQVVKTGIIPDIKTTVVESAKKGEKPFDGYECPCGNHEKSEKVPVTTIVLTTTTKDTTTDTTKGINESCLSDSQKNNNTKKPTITIALVVISDRASQGIYPDKCIPAAEKSITACNNLFTRTTPIISHTTISSDEPKDIKEAILQLTDSSFYQDDLLHTNNDDVDVNTIISSPPNIIITMGGTGFGKRDTTPEVVEELLHKKAPGFVYVMTEASIKATPLGALSRPTAGVRNNTIILTFPGNPKAFHEIFPSMAKLLEHAVLIMNK